MKRDTYLDSAKTVLIFMVVFGHVLGYLGKDAHSSIIYNFIYLVHMPLFVLLSGYFTNTSKSFENVLKGSLELLASFCLFQVIWFIIDPPRSFYAALSPTTTLWYLLSLACWRVMLKVMAGWMTIQWLLFISFMAGLFCGFIPLEREFSLQRTFSFFPFFVVGYGIRLFQLRESIKNFNVILASGILIMALVAFNLLNTDLRWLLCGNNSFYNWPLPLSLAPVVRVGWYLAVLVASVAFMRIIPDVRWLSKQGNKTLTVYLFHYFFIFYFRKIHYTTDFFSLLFAFAILVFILTLLLDKLKFIKKMIRPLQLR